MAPLAHRLLLLLATMPKNYRLKNPLKLQNRI